MKKILFFTRSFPYGFQELWKLHEMAHLAAYFDTVEIIPLSDEGNPHRLEPLPKGVICHEPLLKTASVDTGLRFVRLLFIRKFFYLKEFLARKVFLREERFREWINASELTEKLLDLPAIKEICSMDGKDTVLYFYWGIGAAYIVPFLDKNKFYKIAVRMHRYDLWECYGSGYIPYRLQLLNNATIILPSSQAGADYIKRLYPDIYSKVFLSRCGVTKKELSGMSRDGVLRIVSCSLLIPRKRIDMIARSLAGVDFPVRWTHIGGGECVDQVNGLTRGLPKNIEVELLGMLSSEAVKEFYINNQVDLFIQASDSEGVSFSLMEALSAGVPALATNVGGTSEIIDDSVGKLLPADVTPESIAASLKWFYLLSTDAKIELRKNAVKRFEDMCNADILAEEFAGLLSSKRSIA